MLVEKTHGNINPPVFSGDHSSPITSAKPSDPMAWKTPENNPPHPPHPPPSAAEQPPVRPPLTSHQSNSLPSTPYQHTRNLSFHSRSPSPRHGNTSPRSTHSETTHIPPSLRKPFAGCKYETAMAFFRRRMPYTIGTDLLEEEKDGLKERLDPDEEHKMTTDIMDVYDRLLPSAESDDRRRQLVAKLEKLFNDQWPGHNIKVNVFGSSGNKLCSSDSDVDICITTTYKELEHVCLLAEVLARHGMERVVCISHAKVPIVKIWDPELRLACDMNVNNTLALENTRMVRTYVDIDERVRPLAMMIKHWTKRRILNDAGLGGTLSSYTWICLIINFFQTRNPPILPSLQARPHKKRTTPDGLMCSFDDDLNALSGYGKKNKQSLGELFFQFFRYYAHELNYEKDVISVREGRLVSKEGKGWHLLQNNRLCVEEPFNTSRNLGNTADDTSFRGIHIELRRAFRFLSDGNLAMCCEQYEYPPEEERTWERPPPQPRPVLSAVPSNAARGGGGAGGRGGGGAGRGGRNQNQFGGRGGGHTGGGRRASNTPNKTNNNFRNTNAGMSPSEISLQAQHAQYLLHDHLYQQIQILQAQEQELRLQLQNQALLTGRPPPVLVRQPFIQFPLPQQQQQQQPNSSSSQISQQSPPDPSSPPPPSTSSGGDENSRSRSGTTAGNRPQFYYNPTYLPMAAAAAATGVQGGTTNPTNPPSPSTTSAAAVPDLRRNPRRSSVANGSSPGGSLRAQSQPARTLNSATLPNLAPLYALSQPMDASQNSKSRQGSGASQEGSAQGDDDHAAIPTPSNSLPNGFRSNYLDESRSSEYMGYYLAASQQLQAYHQSMLSNLPAAPVGLALQNGGYIPIMNPQDYMAAVSTSNDTYASSTGTTPTSNGKPSATSQSQQQQSSQQQQQQQPSQPSQEQQPQSHRSTPRAAVSNDRGGPLIVDGSVPPSEPRPVYPIESIDPYASWSQYTANSSDDPNTDTPASASDTFSQDYQDSSSVDIDNPSSLYSRSQPDTNTNANANVNKNSKATEPLVNGNNYVKPGTLSSRLQNLRCSNNDKSGVDSHKMGQDRSKGTSYHHDQNPPAKEVTPKNSRSAVASSTTGEKGLSVTGTETSTSAHNSRRRQPNGIDASEKVNGTNNHRSKPKGSGGGRHDTSHHHGSAGDKERKTNGVNVTVHESNHHSNNHATGGWQTTKKKQKKGGARASTNTGGGGGGGGGGVAHNGVEPLPVDESMRKGG